ncbi:MAG TPA: hypothetical protein PKB15_02230 [Acidimicrobiia bacterium]|nr:hypothetical protein [Acidimicrobiia bacterium]
MPLTYLPIPEHFRVAPDRLAESESAMEALLHARVESSHNQGKFDEFLLAKEHFYDRMGKTPEDMLTSFAHIAPKELLGLVINAHNSVRDYDRDPRQDIVSDAVVIFYDSEGGVIFHPPGTRVDRLDVFSRISESISTYARSAITNGVDAAKAMKRVSASLSLGVDLTHLFQDCNGRTSRVVAGLTLGRFSPDAGTARIEEGGIRTHDQVIFDSILRKGFRVIEPRDEPALNEWLLRSSGGNLNSKSLTEKQQIIHDLEARTDFKSDVWMLGRTNIGQVSAEVFFALYSKRHAEVNGSALPDGEVPGLWSAAKKVPLETLAQAIEGNSGLQGETRDVLLEFGHELDARISSAVNKALSNSADPRTPHVVFPLMGSASR